MESGGQLSSPEIAARLADEGFGIVKESNIRTWKLRDKWTVAKHFALLATDVDTIAPTFAKAADALLTLGVGCVDKLLAFVQSCEPTELAHAEALSRIMTSAIEVASDLDLGVIARHQAAHAAAIARGDTAKIIDGIEMKPAKSHVDSVVAMFSKGTRADREPGLKS